MKVWVLMGNDYPEAVFSDETKANAEVEKRMAQQKEGLKPYETPRIYWRLYDFDLIES